METELQMGLGTGVGGEPWTEALECWRGLQGLFTERLGMVTEPVETLRTYQKVGGSDGRGALCDSPREARMEIVLGVCTELLGPILSISQVFMKKN